MSSWNSNNGQYIADDNDFDLGFGFNNGSSETDFHMGSPRSDLRGGSPEQVPDLAFSQPLSRFSSSNGSSNPSNSDGQMFAVEDLNSRSQYDLGMDQHGSMPPYWGYGLDGFGSQFNPATLTSGFSVPVHYPAVDQVHASQFSNVDISPVSDASPIDFSSLYSGHPDSIHFPHLSNSAPDFSIGYPGVPSFGFKTGVTGRPQREEPSMRRPKHRRSLSSNERLRRPKRDAPLVCLQEGCNSKPFNRPADLDRHYIQIHGSDQDKKSFYCDYARCNRATSPFHRLDHCREHYREFHREDIDKRGVPLTLEWCKDRNVKTNWWRCNKCLARVGINEDNFQCRACHYECPEVRRKIRGY